MTRTFVGAVADDDTGAADLAGMLAERGMRAAVILDSASPQQLRTWAAQCDAVVIGTATRSIAKNEAYTRTRAAIETLRALSPQRLGVKYCSTFDSTPEGNIGSSIDAALDATGDPFTIALPALPALGRTTYMGYHFVGGQLLSESSMRHHPLNPMSNSNLVAHLSTQTYRRVGLVSYADIQAGPNAIRTALHRLQTSGCAIALLDCVDDQQLHSIGEAICNLPLLSGSSAWAMVLPDIWRQNGSWRSSTATDLVAAPGGTGVLLISGSCSQATQSQISWAAQNGWHTFALDAIGLARRSFPVETVGQAAEILARGEPCLITTTQQSGREQVQEWAVQQRVSAVEAGERISRTLARLAAEILHRCMPAGLIIAGGETSSAVMRTLKLGGLLIGPAIDPGVPLCISLAQPSLALVLKSGNFGADDFFRRAVQAVRSIRRGSNTLHKELA